MNCRQWRRTQQGGGAQAAVSVEKLQAQVGLFAPPPTFVTIHDAAASLLKFFSGVVS